MRPNYAQDAPPTSIEVGGNSYPIETDYRVWLGVLEDLRNINFRIDTKESIVKLAEQIESLESKVFGKVIEESIVEVFKAINKFSLGYKSAPIGSMSEDSVKTYSFNYDLNEIIIAIKNQHNVDLSYRCKYFHWWEFLLLFHTLSGEHYILNLMSARGYKGNDKEMKRRRDACALPAELTAEEQAEHDAFNALFDTGG